MAWQASQTNLRSASHIHHEIVDEPPESAQENEVKEGALSGVIVTT